MQKTAVCPSCNFKVLLSDGVAGVCPECRTVIRPGQSKVVKLAERPQIKNRGRVNDESVFFEEGKVRVTASRIEIGGTSYAVRNINAVAVGKASLPKNPASFITLPGLILLVVSLPFIFSGEAMAIHFCVLIAGILLLCLGFGFRDKMEPKQEYVLRFTTTGHDVEAVRDTDCQFLLAIKSAIEDAIAEN